MNRATAVLLASAFVMPDVAAAKLLDGGTNYTPPTASLELENSRNFAMPYDAAWRAVVAHLAETSFVIDNIDKDSGLITVSFSVSDPRTAVDCGQWSYWVKNMRGRRDYNNEAAAPFAAYELLDNRTLVNVERSVSLSGKFNILVTAPTEKTSKVKVTARFVQSVSLKVAPLILDMNFRRVEPRTFTDSMGFNSGQEGQIPNGQTRCRSNGSLEKQVLDGISASLPVGSKSAV